MTPPPEQLWDLPMLHGSLSGLGASPRSSLFGPSACTCGGERCKSNKIKMIKNLSSEGYPASRASWMSCKASLWFPKRTRAADLVTMPYGDDGDYSDDGDHGDHGNHDNNKVKRAIYNLFARATPSSLLFPSLTGAVLAASPHFSS